MNHQQRKLKMLYDETYWERRRRLENEKSGRDKAKDEACKRAGA